MLDKQGWYCFGCGVGGDALQLVEFVQAGMVTCGLSGLDAGIASSSTRFSRGPCWLAALVDTSAAPGKRSLLQKRNIGSPGACGKLSRRWRRSTTNGSSRTPKCSLGSSRSTGSATRRIARLKIGFAENEPGLVRALTDGAGAFTLRELAGTSTFRPTAQDGLFPFFEGRIVFPYWSRGNVVFMIGRRTPWTPDQEWGEIESIEARRPQRPQQRARGECVKNDVLYNEDVLLTRPER